MQQTWLWRERKGQIIEDLDRKRNELASDLDQRRNELAKSLEDHKGNLATGLSDHQHELTVKRGAIDEKIDQIKEARETVTLYRLAIGSLRFGSYTATEVEPYHSKLALCRDRLPRGSELHDIWCQFMELGHYLEERAKDRKPVGQRRLWIESVASHGDRPLGVVFAERGERILSLLDDEAARARTNK